MYTRNPRLLPLCILALLGACADTPKDESALGESQDRLVSTYYESSFGSRTVYARKFDPQGAPRVRFNGKTWSGQCVPTNERSMVPVPESEVTVSLCASVGAEAQFVNGRIAGCVNTSTKTPVGIWKYSWLDVGLKEVNYEVTDLGSNGQVIDTSGWVPTPGNGCPH